MNGDKLKALFTRRPQREVPQMCMMCGVWVFRDGWPGHDCDAPDYPNE